MSTRTWAPLASGTAVQIRCHTVCPWLDRFVVVGTTWLDGEPAYRVRRTGTDPVPAMVVPAGDVRAAP